jgi:sec-independent protein translocase protein TatA
MIEWELKMTEYVQNITAISMPQGLDWVWILLIVLVIFGGRKLPDLARNLGKGLSQFKKGLSDVEQTKDDIVNEIKKDPDSHAAENDSKKTG